MKGRTSKRILSALLSLVMLLSLLPVAAFATETATTATATKITAADQLVSGQYVLVADNGYAPTILSDSWVTATSVTATGDTVTVAPSLLWTITVDGATAKLTDSNGTTIAPFGGNKNGIKSGDYSWTVAFANGTFTFAGQGDDTVKLAGNVGAGNKFRAYKNNTISGNPNGYPSSFTLYKLTSGGETPVPPAETVAEPTANYENGSELPVGTMITFSCATEGATIHYHTGDGNWAEYTDPIELKAYTAFAVKAVRGTAVAEVTFTYKAYTLVDKYVKADTIADGDKVVIVNPTNLKALSSEYTGFYNKGTDVTITDDVLDGYTDADIWTVGVSEDGSYTFATAKGEKLSMDTDYSSMPLDKANTAWEISDAKTDGCVYIKNAVRGNYIEWFAEKSNWSSYGTIADTNEALFAQQFYKLTQDKQYVTDETPDPEPEPEFSTIADALAGAKGAQFTVKGVVTLVDGKNYYLQDATGGICLRLASTTEDIALGDTVIGTGTRAAFNKLPQLDNSTFEKSSGLTLTAKAATIGALTAADVCTYVKLTGLEVTDVYDNNGKYSNPNITLKDADGNTIQLYKAVINKVDGAWEYAVGNKVDVTAAVGINNTTLQLRNTKASEITKARENGIVTTLSDGDTVVIFNPANGKALSTDYAGTYYNQGTDVTLANGKLTGYTKADIWTVGVNADGTYTFSTAEGKKLSMGAKFTSTPLDDVNPNWKITPVSGKDGYFYVDNTGRTDKYRLQWYVANNNWSAYTGTGDNFELQFYLVVDDASDTPDTGDLPKAGDQVVIYNANANAALAAQDDNAESPSITKSGAVELTDDGKLTKGNGAAVFTVEQNGEYLRFYNKTYGYLCANGTGNNAFYSQTASNDADWLVRTCSGGVGGFEMESRTAKYKGYSQWLEYYSDSFKVYSMDKSKVTDYTIYSFYFYPVAETVNVTDGIVNQPTVDFGTVLPAYVGQDYELTFTVDAPFGVDGDMTATLDGTDLTVTKGEDGKYTAIIPVDMVKGDKLTATVSGKDTKNVAITGEAEIEVKNEPTIVNLTPANGEETGDNKRPTIGADVINAGDAPTILLKINGEPVDADYTDGKVTYIPAADMADGKVQVSLTVTRADDKSATADWSFTVGEATYQRYFGQLHGHTQYSDGAGSLTGALDYIAALPESANVQFVAFTDHSNYFDSKNNANVEAALYDTSLVKDSDDSHSWNTYKSTIAAFNAENTGKIVAIGGFEMTWSGGPGHINTFNTPGVVSRNNSTLNNKTSDAGLQAYYALLSQSEGVDSISQFNHPGTTFGNFKDFNYWDPVIDSRMYMVEVGNGEGAIGAGGYYPSYEQYIMALDKGWHLAPTNNQDNHKGKWGNANDARDVILTDDFSEQGIYEAIRALRMYATEDKNLELTYTVNGLMMGSSITEVPDKLNVEVTVNDPDASDSIAKVEVVANSGKVAYTWDNAAQLSSGKLSATLDPSYSYYFIRVTQKDGDLAVTSPVWVGESLKLGISNMVCGTATPVTDEELTLTTTFFNSEDSDATIKSLTYSIGGTVIGTDKTGYTLAKSSTLDVPFKYTPTAARVFTVQVTAVVEQGNNEYTFTKTIGLDVLNADSLVYIGIDASHYNEYVSGNYKDSMGNFGNLAADHSVRTVQLNTGADLIAACSNPKYKALILTAPSRRLADAQTNPKTYSDAELKALADFNAAGGTVILAGWSDNYENYDVIQKNPAIKHMAETQNDVLKALGSSLRISDDATYDDVRSAADGVDKWRLYFSTYNTDNFLTSGVIVDADHPYDKLYTERFSHYGGASIYAVDANGNPASTLPTTVSPVVYGHATTYSIDVDKDGKGGAGTPKYTYAANDSRLLVMATEQLAGKGLIVVSGAAFMSNFEVQAQLDNGAEKNYSNYRICENLVSYLNPVQLSTIAQIHQQPEEGFKYTVEGIVTSNASGHDKDTAFFDCIYIQDETGGINCFPVAGDFKIGDRVRVSGTTSSYQGERQLAVTKIEKIGEGTPVTPLVVTSTQVNDGSVLGSLVKLKGIVTAIEMAEGKVQTILVRDPQGKVARVFIDGYICPDSEVQNLKVGCAIEATGPASYDNTFVLSDGTAMAPRIRISNRADVICTDHTHAFGAWTVTTPATCTASGAEKRTCACGETETRLLPATGHTDANKDGKCDLCGQTLTPATGDTMHLTLWLSLMALTALAGVTLTRQKKRRA